VENVRKNYIKGYYKVEIGKIENGKSGLGLVVESRTDGRFDSIFDSNLNLNTRFDSRFDSNANGRFAGP